MERNLFSRIETCFPIENKKLKKQVIEDGLNNYLKDNRQAWELQADGTWVQCHPKLEERTLYCTATLDELSWVISRNRILTCYDFSNAFERSGVIKIWTKNTIIEQYLVPSLSTNVAFLIRINF
jgi:hypothetical protein